MDIEYKAIFASFLILPHTNEHRATILFYVAPHRLHLAGRTDALAAFMADMLALCDPYYWLKYRACYAKA